MKPYFKHQYLTLLLVACTLLFSCDAIIEPSISKSTVNLEAPVNQYQSTSYTLNFWWDQVDNSLSYHLQVVSPSFAASASLVLDTVIKKNTFSFNFNPGNYQWRVLAQNGSSQTAYAGPRSFSVAASSIKQQAVQLTSPANNALTNQSAITFQWSGLYGATAYRLEIDTNSFANENALVYSQTIPGTQIGFTFPKDQTYQWRVRAQNDTAQAQWSTIYQVSYDHTPPAAVTLASPADKSTLPLPGALSWNTVGAAVKYKLYVYQSNGTTIYNQNFPITLTGTSYSFNLGKSGYVVYWTVTALDAAGNESIPAALRSFTLQ